MAELRIAKGVIERAFELARQGRCRTLEDIRRVLARESYSAIDAHLAGGTIRRQLKALMYAAQSAAPEPKANCAFEAAEGEPA